MKITLELVRQTLRETLGFDSFVASFIAEVREENDNPSVSINKDGVLGYNPQFVSRYVSCKEDMFSLIFHELLHPMFGHFIYQGGPIENIAADAIINGAISIIYPYESRDGSLFKKTHAPTGLDGLMRPSSQLRNSRYWRVYEKLYSQDRHKGDSMTTGELIQTLKILTQTENLSAVMLLGTHGKGDERDDGAGDGNGTLPQEILARFAEEFKRSVRSKAGNQPWYSETLMSLLMEALRTHLSIKKVLLERFATKRKLDRFKELFQDRRISVSPIPLHPSKRDLVLLSAGIYPWCFHNKLTRHQTRDRGLAIYLDVSGSVNEYLPKILGVLNSLKKEITTVFQFSNKVVETSFESLLKGDIKTTYGTDFNCIAQSILERGFDKAVVITDGYASMNAELNQQLKKQKLMTLTILFDEAQSCPDFAGCGEVVLLEDVTD